MSDATVRTIYHAFAAGDVQTVLASFSPGIVWNEAENFPYADGNPYIGPQAVLEGVFARCLEQWEGFAIVIATGRYTGVYKATGRSQSTQIVHIWRIEGGRAVRFQQHADTLQTARVMGTA